MIKDLFGAFFKTLGRILCYVFIGFIIYILIEKGFLNG